MTFTDIGNAMRRGFGRKLTNAQVSALERVRMDSDEFAKTQQTPGYAVFRARIEAAMEKEQAALLALKWWQFSLGAGLEHKGRLAALREVWLLEADIVAEGDEARQVLEAVNAAGGGNGAGTNRFSQ